MKRMAAMVAALALLGLPACRAGRPLMSSTPADKTTPGTIGGILKDVGGEPIAGRTVHAVGTTNPTDSFSAVTNITGGFSIKVPPGEYRLRVDLLEGESVKKEPGVIHINKSDLDANLEVVIGR